MYTLLQNFLLGFAVTAIPGAVFFETLRRTLSEKSSIIRFMAGNYTGMFLIIFSVLFGLAAFLSNPSLSRGFYILSGAVLLYIGATSLFSKYRHDTARPMSKTRSRPGYPAFLTGFILAAANPISIVFWISMTGKMIQQKLGIGAVVLNCASIVLGATVVFALLIFIAGRSKNKITDRHFLILSRGFGLTILIYGLVTMSKVLS